MFIAWVSDPAAAAAAAKSLQSCPTLCDPIDGSPPGSAILGILRAKNTEVGCHFLLQCMKMKSENGVAQLCQTLSDPMDCSLPGSSIHGISTQEKTLHMTSPDGQHRNQIDYVLCSQRWRSSIQSTKTNQELTVAQTMNSLLPNSHLN